MSFNKNQFKELIEETLKEVDMYSESAVNLLLGTAAQESAFGTYLKQIKGPALGVFQMEPDTYRDIFDHYLKYRPNMIPWLKDRGALVMVYNLRFAIIMCRLRYRRVSEKLPENKDVNGLARYWKKYYNTKLGKGTEEEFIKNYEKYVL
ncbi:MAG: exodeoxyribonuclease V subunit gamma [archaeon]|nr:exodeoxyribonuclease V subunit gamma [archaeon]